MITLDLLVIRCAMISLTVPEGRGPNCGCNMVYIASGVLRARKPTLQHGSVDFSAWHELMHLTLYVIRFAMPHQPILGTPVV